MKHELESRQLIKTIVKLLDLEEAKTKEPCFVNRSALSDATLVHEVDEMVE